MFSSFILGWLNSRIQTKDRTEEKTRGQMYIENGVHDVWPSVEEGAGLFRFMKYMGWVKENMAGTTPLTAADVVPSATLPDSPVVSWSDVETAVDMSANYFAGMRDGRDPFSVPPWERSR